MGCKFPVRMYRCKKGRTRDGTWPLVANIADGCGDLPVIVPCGRCIHCRLEIARQKTVRITHELLYHEVSCFITLTFNDGNLSYGNLGLPTLTRGQRGDVTLFLKRFRKWLETKMFPVPALRPEIKFFQCGEYGELYQRPHHHMILYGYDFSHDRVIDVKSSTADYTVYRSKTLESLWGKGDCHIGTVSWDSASYVASYCVKKLLGDDADAQYDDLGRIPPYMTSSLGIGKKWITQWINDVYPRDYIVVRGHRCKPPRYYDEYLRNHNPDLYEEVILARQRREHPDDYYDNAIAASLKKEKMLQFHKNPKF